MATYNIIVLILFFIFPFHFILIHGYCVVFYGAVPSSSSSSSIAFVGPNRWFFFLHRVEIYHLVIVYTYDGLGAAARGGGEKSV